MSSRAEITARLEFRRAALQEAQKAYIELLSGRSKSYTIGSRSMTKFDLQELETTIGKLEKEVAELEEQLRSGKARKAVGVVIRDW